MPIARLDVGVVAAHTPEQIVVLTRICLRKAAFRGRREAAPGNHHAVIGISRAWNDEAGGGIDLHRFAGIVEPRVEHSHVPPQGAIRNADRVTQTIVDVKLLVDFPGILSESLPHAATEDCVCTVADFRIRIEHPQSGVCYTGPSSGVARSTVGEQELAILVVGASGASLHVDLIIIVLARALKQAAELQGVAAIDPGEAVGNIVDRPGGVRRIRSAAELGERAYVHGRDTRGDQFSLRKDVWVIDSGNGPIKEVRGVNGNVDVVQTGGEQDLVDLRRADGPDVIQRVGLVGAVEKLRRTIGVAVERLIFEIGKIHAAELKPLLVRQVHVGAQCIFVLFLCVEFRREPVAVATDRGGEVGLRPCVQEANAVRAQHVFRNYVAGKWDATRRILDDHGLAIENVVRIQEFTEIASPHFHGRNGEQARRSNRGARLREVVLHPFLAPIPEELASVLIESSRDVERAVDVVPILVVMDRRRGCGNGIGVAGPCICVQIRVAQVLECGAVELLGAGSGENADLSAG